MNQHPSTLGHHDDAGGSSGDTWQSQPTLDQLTSHDIWWLRRGFLERLWPNVTGWKVLEVGSGPAHDSITFAKRGASVTALDQSQPGLRLAERMYGELDLPIETVLADAGDLPIEDDQYDLAFNAGVLEHFEDDALERVIDEMIRVVRPGGQVLAFCPNRHNIFYQKHLQRVNQHRYEFERAFTAAELRTRFEARGLGNLRVSGVHVHPAVNYLLPSWLPKHHRIEPWMRFGFGPLERLDGMNRLKSLIGQDFVVWGEVAASPGRVRSIGTLGGGPAVKLTQAGQEHRHAA